MLKPALKTFAMTAGLAIVLAAASLPAQARISYPSAKIAAIDKALAKPKVGKARVAKAKALRE
jgi:hypothetical protein